ncbi:hypothetical protein HA052_15020 [Chromobacterium haemolyticum]|uniref:Uncharacterized protein n=1 Tax=Chromobacterium fluminis TaxID=3044269 RepID=A0ABX0L678_9NEIS|nr:hypothetical protein [Chromobacterium haemolyticum]NHR06503.1 hypothetical protein [Chromobacterium haemolyticum]
MVPTHKQIAAGQRRSLLAMQRKLQDMAAQWEDLDAYNAGTLADLAEKIGDTAGDLIEKG